MLYAHILLSVSPPPPFSLNAAAAAKLCIECISKDCPQVGYLLKQVVFHGMWVHCDVLPDRSEYDFTH